MKTDVRHLCRCLAVIATLGLAACTSGTGTAAPSPVVSSPAVSSPVPSAVPGSVAPSSPAAPTALPSAADGGKLAACQDGRCEVVVKRESTIQLNRSLGLYAVAVYEIDDDEIGLFASLRGGGSFACDGDDRCQVSVRGQSGQNPPSAQFVAHPGARLQVAKVRIQVVAVVRDRAVLRLSTVK